MWVLAVTPVDAAPALGPYCITLFVKGVLVSAYPNKASSSSNGGDSPMAIKTSFHQCWLLHWYELLKESAWKTRVDSENRFFVQGINRRQLLYLKIQKIKQDTHVRDGPVDVTQTQFLQL